MSDGHGGYRKPANPAPASGPGKLSRRTDGGPGQKVMVPDGLPYGDRQQLAAQESTAAMSQTPSVDTMPVQSGGGQQGAPAGPPQMSVPFGAPTAMPNQPVTHGVNIGPGPGPGAIPQPPTAMPQRGDGAIASMFRQLSASSTSGDLAALYQAALTRGV